MPQISPTRHSIWQNQITRGLKIEQEPIHGRWRPSASPIKCPVSLHPCLLFLCLSIPAPSTFPHLFFFYELSWKLPQRLLTNLRLRPRWVSRLSRSCLSNHTAKNIDMPFLLSRGHEHRWGQPRKFAARALRTQESFPSAWRRCCQGMVTLSTFLSEHVISPYVWEHLLILRHTLFLGLFHWPFRLLRMLW